MTKAERAQRKIVIAALKTALRDAQRLCQEALPQFEWGPSALDANALQLLNEVPGQIARALALAEQEWKD